MAAYKIEYEQRYNKFLKCEWCGETKIVGRKTKRFCGRSCAAKFSWENGNFNKLHGFKEIPCPTCGKLNIKTLCKIKQNRRFCNMSCAGKYVSKKRRAKTKGGLDKVWSVIVKHKAGGKCEICGKTENLNSHHIIGRRNHATRWYIPNGVCLCVKHHLFGIESAHQNMIWFMNKMRKLRGDELLNNLLERGKTICKWKKEIEVIQEHLYEETDELNTENWRI